MNYSFYNKLEIDVMQINEIQDATELAHKYNLPAIVVHPGLSSNAIIARTRINGKFKIITPIDWPKGDIYGTTKLRGLTIDSLETDGFEFLLTSNKSELETRHECHTLTNFVKNNLTDSNEVRFVLGTSFRSDENIISLCNGILTTRTPAYIRTDINSKLQVNKANAEEHNRQMQMIRNIIKAPIKISGNITNLKTIAECVSASRFGVNLIQARTLIKEFQSNPDFLRDTTQI